MRRILLMQDTAGSRSGGDMGTATASASALVLAAVMAGAGVAHFVVPGVYRPIVPRAIGSAGAWVGLSGATELGCAALLAVPRTRRAGGWLAAGLLVAVFPANVQMALDGGIPGRPFPLGSPAVAWARLPLQVPLVAWAVSVAVTARRVRG